MSSETVEFQPSARVIADSISATTGIRLTSIEVRLHRYMLPELNTHRAFSRNSASSRALSVTRQIRMMAEEPVYPVAWPQERKGMQGGPPLSSEDTETARWLWGSARDHAIYIADQLTELGVHRSVVNRLLEPFMAHTVIVTATDWDDFYAQRLAPADGTAPQAQADIVAAATAMSDVQLDHVPRVLEPGDWHLPYVDDSERDELSVAESIAVSVARCARTSYLTQDGTRDHGLDLKLYHRLRTASPPHWSPMEHAATPTFWNEKSLGNLTGWHQHRHLPAIVV